MISLSSFTSRFAAMALGLALSATGALADDATKIKFSLDWKLQGIHTWFFWAQEKGYFAQEKLDTMRAFGADLEVVASDGGKVTPALFDRFKARIAERAENRARLMAMDVQTFIAAMERWNRYFIDGIDLPIIGATEQQLRSIAAPARSPNSTL